jgi:molecular chaperone HscB
MRKGNALARPLLVGLGAGVRSSEWQMLPPKRALDAAPLAASLAASVVRVAAGSRAREVGPPACFPQALAGAQLQCADAVPGRGAWAGRTVAPLCGRTCTRVGSALPRAQLSVAAAQERQAGACWSCGAPFPAGSSRVPIFCGACGIIQPAEEGGTLFELFGIAHEFDIDVQDLELRYKKLMTQLHPDRFMQKGNAEQHHSAVQSSAVNDGFNILKHPHSRAVYMLKLLGVDFDQSQSDFGGSNMQFMVEVMEASDEIEAAGSDQQKLQEIWKSFYLPHLSQICAAASAAFAQGDLTAAAGATAKLQYLKRVGDLLGSAIDVQ